MINDAYCCCYITDNINVSLRIDNNSYFLKFQ